jgi:carbamoyltransferase
MPIDEYYKVIAKSAQEHLEKVALNLLEYLHEKTRSQNLCLAGGVALNVLMNQKLMESKFVENVHLTSVPGDNGLSLGAAIIQHTTFCTLMTTRFDDGISICNYSQYIHACMYVF